ncbi:hypothetical protein E2562_026559 [Oryza meyeriana var. granulata]|uniref:Uncharacterized protein n=1 Tax=Oryza meyeriana var. granulata TaxID=110450 RepID=A0A6G1CUL7_9ORYZ|nr:hypothetical protein E2562_026559 [Oryza meyeriana var. granulata]
MKTLLDIAKRSMDLNDKTISAVTECIFEILRKCWFSNGSTFDIKTGWVTQDDCGARTGQRDESAMENDWGDWRWHARMWLGRRIAGHAREEITRRWFSRILSALRDRRLRRRRSCPRISRQLRPRKACSQAGSFLDVDWLVCAVDAADDILSYQYAESIEAGRRTAGQSSAAAPEAQARSHAGSSTRGRLAGRSSGRASLASSSARSEWGRRSYRAKYVPPFCELRGGVAHGDSTVAGQHTGGAEPGGQGWRR